MSWYEDRKSTRLNSSHSQISYAVFCLKKKKKRLRRCRHSQSSIPRSDTACRMVLRLTYVRSDGYLCPRHFRSLLFSAFLGFFFNDTATTEIYTLSLHDALPI